MHSIWREGQERMLEVYRSAKLDKLAMRQEGLLPGGLSALRMPEEAVAEA